MTSELRQREPRIHEPGYLAWLRTRPCVICGRTPSEAAHFKAPDLLLKKEHPGMGAKSHDKWALPLCSHHHRGPGGQHSWGDEIGWWIQMGKEPFKLCEKYHRNYRAETSAPVVEVQRYKKKVKKVKKRDQPKQKIQNRVQPWPKRPFSKKRATKQ